jgi:DNA-binding transcriptional MocR family regulator
MRAVTAARLATLVGDDALAASPAYRALADAIRLVITDGRVAPGTRLPSERELTAALGVSRTTVTGAYRELKERGYLVARQGSGSVATLPGGGGEIAQRSLIPRGPGQDTLDLTCATLSAAVGVAAAYEAAVAELPPWLTTGGYDATGLRVLREAIARHYEARGLVTDPEQVIVTTGAVSGLAITLRALVRTGDRVLMENPAYPNAVDTAMHTGARLVTYPLDVDGWDLDLLDATLRQTSPRVALLVPDFHNPTGLLLDDEGRAAAARMLRRNRAATVVDETMADLSLTDDPLPRPFAAYDGDVVSLGSMSKSFWGGLRIGWIRAPHALVNPLLESRATLDLSTPILEQLVAARLLDQSEEILGDRRATLRHQRDVLVDALRRHVPEWEVPVPAGGMSLWAKLPERISTQLVSAAERHGLFLAAGHRFGVDGGFEQYLRVPFGFTPEVLEEAATRLAAAYRDALTTTRRPEPMRGPLIA